MAEAGRAAEVAGVARVHWLGYSDSGMAGWQQNDEPDAFVQADLDEAAGRLVALLDQERPEVLVGYDWHGNYGHPDHIKVHQVVRRAAELTPGRPRLFEATMNRDASRAQFEAAKAAGIAGANDFDPDAPMNDGNPLGTPEAEIALQVDVSDYLARRREVMACHVSQVTDVQGMLALPEPAFAGMFSREHFIEVETGNPRPMRVGWFF
jgi:LmbE family N-acetylglucosaminyl deacetylase